MASVRKKVPARQIIEIDPRPDDLQPELPHIPPKPNPRKRYVAVAGNIGSGKSSLVDFLCQRHEIRPFFEPNDDNPYLADFYADMDRWSFHSQVFFLTAKFKLHLELDATDESVVQDRTIWEDAEIFAENLYRQGTMSERDYRTYRMLYESVQDKIRPPDLMIYLRCPVDTLVRRIAQRGREMEQDIPTAYLARLHKLYEGWIADYTLSPLVIIPTSEVDPVTDLVDSYEIQTTFERYL